MNPNLPRSLFLILRGQLQGDERPESSKRSLKQSFTFKMGAALKKRLTRLVHHNGDHDPFASFSKKSTTNLLNLGFCIDNERSTRAVNPESSVLLYWESWVLITTICIAMVTPYEVRLSAALRNSCDGANELHQ